VKELVALNAQLKTIYIEEKLMVEMTCLVLSDQFHLETLAPVINSFCHPATNSAGV